MKIKLLFASALFTIATHQIFAQIITTESFPYVNGISNSGLVTGSVKFGGAYVIWNPDTNSLENIGGFAPGTSHGGNAMFSNDGVFISGTGPSHINPNYGEMSRYNTITKEWQKLGNAPANSNGFTGDYSNAYAISQDGKTLAGLSFNTAHKAIGFVWNETKGNVVLESKFPNGNARVNALSGDGSVAVGYQDIRGSWRSSVWTRKSDGTYNVNKVLLVNPNASEEDPYNQLAEASTISADGKWIGGRSDGAFPNAWIWSEETGVKSLGNLSTSPNTISYVNSISPDGKIVLGYIKISSPSGDTYEYQPYIWTEEKGMMDFNEYVKNQLGYDMQDLKINVAVAISSNLKYILAWTQTKTGMKITRIQLPENFLATQSPVIKNEVKLYPNPVTDVLNIDSKDKVESVKIYNAAGQLVNQSKLDANKKINVASLTTGVYNVNVTTDKGSQTYKVIKK